MLGVLPLLAAGTQGRGPSRTRVITPWPLHPFSPLALGQHLPASLAQARQAPGAKSAGLLMLILRFAELFLALPRWFQSLAGPAGKASPQPPPHPSTLDLTKLQ